MKKYLMILFFSLLFINLAAQKHDKVGFPADHASRLMRNIHNLKIGQKVPAVYLHEILNYKDSSATLSSLYRDKLLIIDFWATWCPPCIASLPSLDSIQKEFPNKLRIITVTYEPEKKVRALFQKNKTVAASSLPFVVNDRQLNSLFRHRVVPHEVWIDSNGYVRAVTNNYDITQKNIDKVLNNNHIYILTKKDSLNFNPSKYSNFGDSDILYRSVLAKSNFNLNGGYVDAIKNYTYYKRLYLTNRSAIQLFYSAFSRGTSAVVNPRRVIYDTPDSLRYKVEPTRAFFNNSDSLKSKYAYFEQWVNDWAKSNSFCYELIEKDYIPDTAFFRHMMQNLNHYFDITATVQKRLIPCIVIKLKNPGDNHLLKTSGLKTYTFWSGGKADTLKRIQNNNWAYLINVLNSFKLNDPVVDETGFSGRVDINLNLGGFSQHKKFDYKQLRKSLSKYGLKVVKEMHPANVLVINNR